MKSMGGKPDAIKKGVVTAEEMLRYALRELAGNP